MSSGENDTRRRPTMNPELEALMEKARQADLRMTPDQRAEQNLRQRVSYARGEMGLSHPDWSQERLDELLEKSPEGWALREIDRLRGILDKLGVIYC